MRTGLWLPLIVIAMLLGTCAMSTNCMADEPGQPGLEAAARAYAECTVLLEETAKLPEVVREPMKRALLQARAEALAGTMLMNKEKYAEAIRAFELSAALSRKVLEGRGMLERIFVTPGQAPPPPQPPAFVQPAPQYIPAPSPESQLAELRRAWAAAMSHFDDAINKSAQAELHASAGRTAQAAAAYNEALNILRRAMEAAQHPQVSAWQDGATWPRPKESLLLDLGEGVEMEFVLIKPGKFMMGDPDGDLGEKPVHEVRITRPFYLGKYKVTQRQWEVVMGNNPSYFKGPRNPVENINWEEAQTFLQKLNERLAHTGLKFRLPTSAQREYACRAGSTTRYSFGDNAEELDQYAWYRRNSDGRTHPVGEKKPNAWGLYDMHGNTWEMCLDWFDDQSDYYGQSPTDDPQGPAFGAFRVIRGGSWSASPARCGSGRRYPCNMQVRINNCGLRVACEP
jgi:formylglycine-generating enzyme required for sulfatase activity